MAGSSRPNSGTADAANSSKGTPHVAATARPVANGIPRHAAARAERSPASAQKTPSPSSADHPSPKIASRISTLPSAEKQKQRSAVKKQSMEVEQLAAIQEELRRAKGQLAEKETEHRKVADDARRAADEANAKLRYALAELKKAEEASETEMFRAVELEQTTIESTQRKHELQRRLEADAAALQSMVAQLEEARLELADAIDAKNLALSHADDAIRAGEANAAQVELLNAEIKRLQDSFNSELESKVKESAEKTRKLEAEASVLRINLKKAKVAEEKVAELEGVVEGLRVDVANAIKARREANGLVGEWKKKAQLLEIKLELANQSSILKAESMSSVMKELDAANALLQVKESQLALLHNKIESLEHEVVRQNKDINASGQRVDAAQREALALGTEIQELRSRLGAMEQEKRDAIKDGSFASSQIEAICEEKDKLAKELESSKGECEKIRKAMEDLACALQEMSAEARESRESYLDKQEEIVRNQAKVQELNMSLNNTRENYEVMLDEANYERICLKNKVEQLEVEAKTTSEEWRSKELSFVTSITNSEEETMSMRIQLGKLAETARDMENRNAQLEEKVRELEALMAEDNNYRGGKDTKAYRENDGLHLQVKESSGSEKIKDLYSLIGNEKGNTEKDAPVLLVSKMWENSKVADYNLSERDDGEPEVDLLDTNRDTAADGNGSRLSTEKTKSNTKLVVKQNQQKKALMKKFGGLLKKKSQH